MQERQNSKINQFRSDKSGYGEKCFARKSLWCFTNPKRGASAESSTLLLSALRPRLGCVGIEVAGIIALGGLYCSVSNANNASATTVTLTVPQNITVNADPAINGGFAESTNSEISINNSSKNGYTLSIKAKDDTNGNDLVNESNKNSKLASIPETLTLDEYKTGKNGNNFLNTWAFKPDVLNNQVNSNYLPGPTTSGIKIAETTSNSLNGETFNFAIATKVNNAIASGNYSNNFILTATGNNYKYNIKFNNNGGSGGPSGPMTGEAASPEIQIVQDVPTNGDEDFLGWCSREPISDGSCPGITVQPNGYFPLPDGNLDITLYAMWGTKGTSGGGGGGGQFSGIADGTACEHNGKQGKVYGGRCWMNSNVASGHTWVQAFQDCESIGWTLPSQEDFSYLVGHTGGTNASTLNSKGFPGGNYWSSTLYYAANYYAAYYLGVNSSNASLLGNYATNNTLKVRCVAL